MSELKTLFLKTLLIAATGAIAGLAFNAVRPGGLPWIARQPYETFVPCPEPVKEITPIEPGAFSMNDPAVLLIDARPPAPRRTPLIPSAFHIPFDYLKPVSDTLLNRIAQSGSKKIIVFGDGGNPDNGHELARELAGRGIRNLFYLKGGVTRLLQEKPEGSCL